MTRIRITAAGQTFIGETNPEAPETVAAFLKLLPYRQRLIHVRWSGEACWIPMGEFKLGVGFENHTSHPSIGDVLFYPGGYSETGLLSSPIVMTSAFSIGVARDTLLALPFLHGVPERWHQPCAAETNDGLLNDGLAAPVRREHVEAAIAAAITGPVAEGAVGGGTGMMSFEFKSGIGTSSRRVHAAGRPWTVGVLVQSNFGNRRHLTVDGVPVGRDLGYNVTPSPLQRDAGKVDETKGSIVIVLATDAPLLPPQLNRLARRANAGLSRVGGYGNNRSGDFALAFSTANMLPFHQVGLVHGLTMLGGEDMNPLLPAAAEAAEEAIVNSLTMASTMTGVRGTTVHQLPLDRLQGLMRHRRAGTA